MIFREILPRGGIFHTAGIISFGKWKTRPFPFVPKPPLHIHLRAVNIEQSFFRVLNANFRRYRKFSEGLAVCVTSDMRDSLIPDMAISVFPTMFD